MRERVWNALDLSLGRQGPAHWIQGALAVLILLNVAATLLDTGWTVFPDWVGRALLLFELGSLCIFAGEYAMRLWSCTSDARFAHPVWGRVRFVLRPLNVLDLVAIAPLFLAGLEADLRFLRLCRPLVLLRLLRLRGYFRSAWLLREALIMKRHELGLTLALLASLMTMASLLMLVVERHAQPAAFDTLGHALWWAVVTATTVGYGDLIPQTMLGRLLGASVAIVGAGMVALPTAILTTAFLEQTHAAREAESAARAAEGSRAGGCAGGASEDWKYCPHCGKRLE